MFKMFKTKTKVYSVKIVDYFIVGTNKLGDF